MSGRSYRKIKNSGAIDSWLEDLGYYRKNVAYDETCLFRAIAEQLYCSQMQHERVRMECVAYGELYPQEFDGLLGGRRHWFRHLSELAVHMVICGPIEFQLISKTYQRDIIVFNGITFETKNATENNYDDDAFLLCMVSKDHYDVVYSRDYITAAGICQSIAYGILYENVFGVENVNDIVNTMLYGKTSSTESEKEGEAAEGAEIEFLGGLSVKGEDELQSPVTASLAPFPYKVAKALDPDIYRNIAYDTWTEMRREMRLGEWYHGDDRLILGTCCELKLDDDCTITCYIQEFLKGKEECVVYVPSWAERKVVKYGDLARERDAKPWPLPYRFTKHSQSPLPILALPAERRNYRKNKDKGLHCNIAKAQEAERELKAFEGCPLQMHTPPVLQSDQPEMVILSPAPSVVTTPQVYPQTDMNMNIPSPFIYSYPTPPFSYDAAAYQPTTPTAAPPPIPTDYQQPPPPLYYPTTYDADTHLATPTTPPAALYSMPGTPVLYSPPPPLPPAAAEQAELITTSASCQMSYYAASSVEVQYLPPSPYVYSPTPPPWYPPGVNSQGFVFPTAAAPYNTRNGY